MIGTDQPELVYERRGSTAVVILNRPRQGNALTQAMAAAIVEVWHTVMADPGVRALVITGAGDRHFCTGLDLHEFAATGRTTVDDGSTHDAIAWSPLHHGVTKPVICALNGLVAGGGLHFVADADIVVATPHAQVMDTHTSVGIVGAVENVGLTRRLPLGTVLRLTLQGRHFRLSADRAHELGLFDEVCEPDELLPLALSIAESIARNSPSAVEASKRAIWGSLDHGLRQGQEAAWEIAVEQRQHPDFQEGARAYAEGRPPQWSIE